MGPAAQRKGFFISVEGGDGAGKSTQISRLAESLRATGREVILTREPGGSQGAESIRKLLVEGAADRWSPLTEALLMYAARADHLERTILPALATGAIVVTDRFADSTMAYQGIAGALGAETIGALHDCVVGENDPDLTLILDISPDEGLSRAGARDGAGQGRFEAKGADFQKRVREAFLEIARAAPQRCVVIDAAGGPEEVAARVLKAVREKLPALFKD